MMAKDTKKSRNGVPSVCEPLTQCTRLKMQQKQCPTTYDLGVLIGELSPLCKSFMVLLADLLHCFRVDC